LSAVPFLSGSDVEAAVSPERALEVVEHGQELGHDPLARAGEDLRLLACNPLAVVVELGGLS